MSIIMYALVNALDFLTTLIAGVQFERNSIVKTVLEQYGFAGFALGKALVVAYFIVVTYLMKRMRVPRVVVSFYQGLSICLMVIVVAWNIRFITLVALR